MNSTGYNFILALAFLGVSILPRIYGAAHGYQTGSVNLFPHTNKLNEKLSASDQAAEKSFQQFIHSKPEQSTLIGEFRPNASELEIMLMKNKIASTIMSMQEMDKALESGSLEKEVTDSECFIEVTRSYPPNKVERVPGKCQKSNNGLPLCQSENYMSINPACNG